LLLIRQVLSDVIILFLWKEQRQEMEQLILVTSEDIMKKEKKAIVKCKKCGNEPSIGRNNNNILFVIKCVCGNVSEAFCVSSDAIIDWDKKNK
jgi:hypothetical protein